MPLWSSETPSASSTIITNRKILQAEFMIRRRKWKKKSQNTNPRSNSSVCLHDTWSLKLISLSLATWRQYFLRSHEKPIRQLWLSSYLRSKSCPHLWERENLIFKLDLESITPSFLLWSILNFLDGFSLICKPAYSKNLNRNSFWVTHKLLLSNANDFREILQSILQLASL